MPDALDTLLDVRRRQLDEVRLALATAASRATEAYRALKDAEQSIELEAARASDTGNGDDLVEAFAAWLPLARAEVAHARAAHEAEEAEVGRRRAELQACRTALETVEALIAARRARAAEAEMRRTNAALDDLASRRPTWR